MDLTVIRDILNYLGFAVGIVGLIYDIRADNKQKEQERLQKEKDARN